jgi:hypothetical protein
MSESQFGTEALLERKKVMYEGTDVIREGMPVAYNYNTLDNINGLDQGVSPAVKRGTTTEGGQNEGKFQRVELCTADNAEFFAGVVAGTSFAGITGTGNMWIDIYVANGAVMPVRTDKSITIKDGLFLEDGSQEVVNDALTLPRIGTAMETIDRSSVTGLVLAKVNPVAGVGSQGAYASASNAPALATGDIMLPIELGGTTYFIVALQDDGTS